MLQMTTQELRTFEEQLASKAARGNCLAQETQSKLQTLPHDAARIEYLRGLVEQAQQAVFWVKALPKMKRKKKVSTAKV